MEQLEITVPNMTLARAKGEAAGQHCADKAERVSEFNREGAARFIFGYLSRHGMTSGEQLVKQTEAHGYRAHDGRAFGPVFKSLLNKGLVRVVRSDLPREHGHGTSGGKLYEATRKAWTE